MYRIAVATLLALFPAQLLLASPRVAVSIAPIHSLVQAVMDGVGEPQLILSTNQSPHTGSLSPSAVRAVLSADLLVWVGPQLETQLRKLVDQKASEEIFTLTDSPELSLLRFRGAGIRLDTVKKTQPDPTDQHQGVPTNLDPHLWLSAHNAVSIVEMISNWLSRHDIDNARIYRSNASATVIKIGQLQKQIIEQLDPLQDLNFVTFHDAYQYFEHEFGFRSSASIAIGAEIRPGAKNLSDLRQYLKQHEMQCIFSEPQFDSSAIDVLVEGTDIRTSELDPMGVGLDPGKELWFELMQNIARGIGQCLVQD